MIFNKEKRLCLLLPPKTGTHTARHFLFWNGWNKTAEYHIPADKAVERYPNLKNYQLYSFIRNPLDRFVSCILYFKQNSTTRKKVEGVIENHNLQVSVEEVSYEMLLPYIDELDAEYKIMLCPQSVFFTQPNVEALDFDNFDAELRRISGLLDPVKYPIEAKNRSSDWGKSVITDKVRAFVREYYAADYALAKDRLGKEYV